MVILLVIDRIHERGVRLSWIRSIHGPIRTSINSVCLGLQTREEVLVFPIYMRSHVSCSHLFPMVKHQRGSNILGFCMICSSY